MTEKQESFQENVVFSAEDFISPPVEEEVPDGPQTHGPEEAMPGTLEEDEGVIFDEVGDADI